MECVMKKNEKALTVAFTGGGGKTSLILGLAEIFSGQGKRVIVTTTTHMATGTSFCGGRGHSGSMPAYRTIRIRHRGSSQGRAAKDFRPRKGDPGKAARLL